MHELLAQIGRTLVFPLTLPRNSLPRTLARYQPHHVTCKLKISSIDLQPAGQSESQILKSGFVIGGKFKLIYHVTSLIPYKDSNWLPGYYWVV